MDDLSMLQKRVFVFIKSFMNNYGYPPTVREIAKGADIGSTSTVHSALNILESKGYIYRDMGQSRSIVVAGTSTESGIFSIPLLTNGERAVGFVDIPKSLVVSREGVFAVKTTCNIEEKSILSGDVLIAKACENVSEIKDGETVIYEDNSVGVYYSAIDEHYFTGEYKDSLSELYALDAYDSYDDYDDYDSEAGKGEKAVIGRVIACIRQL